MCPAWGVVRRPAHALAALPLRDPRQRGSLPLSLQRSAGSTVLSKTKKLSESPFVTLNASHWTHLSLPPNGFLVAPDQGLAVCQLALKMQHASSVAVRTVLPRLSFHSQKDRKPSQGHLPARFRSRVSLQNSPSMRSGVQRSLMQAATKSQKPFAVNCANLKIVLLLQAPL